MPRLQRRSPNAEVEKNAQTAVGCVLHLVHFIRTSLKVVLSFNTLSTKPFNMLQFSEESKVRQDGDV